MSGHAAGTIDRIRRWYLGEDVILSEDEQECLKRWEEAFTFLRESKSFTETVLMLQRRFPHRSKRILYKDVNSAIQLFGDIVSYSKDAMKKLTIDYALDYLKRCRASGDRTNESRALAMLIKVNGLDREQLEADQVDRPTAPPVIQIPEHVAGLLAALPAAGAVNLMQLRESKPILNEPESNHVQPPATSAGNSSAEA